MMEIRPSYLHNGISCTFEISLYWIRAQMPYTWQAIIWTNDGLVYWPVHIDGLVQDCSISIANALEILQFCTQLSNICFTLPQRFNDLHAKLFLRKNECSFSTTPSVQHWDGAGSWNPCSWETDPVIRQCHGCWWPGNRDCPRQRYWDILPYFSKKSHCYFEMTNFYHWNLIRICAILELVWNSPIVLQVQAYPCGNASCPAGYKEPWCWLFLLEHPVATFSFY